MTAPVKPKQDPSKTTEPKSMERIPGTNGFWQGGPSGQGSPKWHSYVDKTVDNKNSASRESHEPSTAPITPR